MHGSRLVYSTTTGEKPYRREPRFSEATGREPEHTESYGEKRARFWRSLARKVAAGARVKR